MAFFCFINSFLDGLFNCTYLINCNDLRFFYSQCLIRRWLWIITQKSIDYSWLSKVIHRWMNGCMWKTWVLGVSRYGWLCPCLIGVWKIRFDATFILFKYRCQCLILNHLRYLSAWVRRQLGRVPELSTILLSIFKWILSLYEGIIEITEFPI